MIGLGRPHCVEVILPLLCGEKATSKLEMERGEARPSFFFARPHDQNVLVQCAQKVEEFKRSPAPSSNDEHRTVRIL